MQEEIKIVVLGNGGVGKSALTAQFVQNVFLAKYDPTIEDAYRKLIEVDCEQYMLEILDTAGTEQFTAMRELHFMRMHGQGFVLVYSVTALSTFNEIPHFVDQILNYRDGQSAPMVLVGNKVDLQHQRVVTPYQGEQLARQLNCPYFETSAMTKHNVDAIFYDLVRQIINVRMKARQTRPGPASNRRLCIIL